MFALLCLIVFPVMVLFPVHLYTSFDLPITSPYPLYYFSAFYNRIHGIKSTTTLIWRVRRFTRKILKTLILVGFKVPAAMDWLCSPLLSSSNHRYSIWRDLLLKVYPSEDHISRSQIFSLTREQLYSIGILAYDTV